MFNVPDPSSTVISRRNYDLSKEMANSYTEILVFKLIINLFCVQIGFSNKLSPQPIWNSTYTDKLRQDLLLNYDKFARPTQHYNVTTVLFGPTIRHVEFNEFKSTLNVHAWLHLVDIIRWNDEKLKWNSTNYGDVTILHVADHEIWQPDIFLYNSATSTAMTHYGNVHCLVYENGDVIWVPPAQFQVLCNLNLKYWPYDRQTCVLTFGSWTYNGDQIDIESLNNMTTPNIELLIEDSEWRVEKTSLTKKLKFYSCCPEPYPSIDVEIVLQRISPSYEAIIVTPAFVIIILILFVFLLPPDAGEKLLLSGCNSIFITLFMIYFSQKIPAMGTHIPLIVLYYRACLFVTAFSTILSVVTIWISRTKHSQPLPWAIREKLTGTFGKILCLQYHEPKNTMPQRVTAEEMRDHQVADEENLSGDENHIIKSFKKKPTQDEWLLLATAIDRIAFIFFVLLFAILLIVYSV